MHSFNKNILYIFICVFYKIFDIKNIVIWGYTSVPIYIQTKLS